MKQNVDRGQIYIVALWNPFGEGDRFEGSAPRVAEEFAVGSQSQTAEKCTESGICASKGE